MHNYSLERHLAIQEWGLMADLGRERMGDLKQLERLGMAVKEEGCREAETTIIVRALGTQGPKMCSQGQYADAEYHRERDWVAARRMLTRKI